MSALVGGWIRRNASAWMPGLASRFAVAHIGSHPFVPAELSPVAHCSIHRPSVPNQNCGADFRLTRPFCGPHAAVVVRDRASRSTRPRRHVHDANAGAASNKSPLVFGPPPPARSSRGSLAHPGVEVLQGRVLAGGLHRRLDQNPELFSLFNSPPAASPSCLSIAGSLSQNWYASQSVDSRRVRQDSLASSSRPRSWASAR